MTLEDTMNAETVYHVEQANGKPVYTGKGEAGKREALNSMEFLKAKRPEWKIRLVIGPEDVVNERISRYLNRDKAPERMTHKWGREGGNNG